MSVDSKPRGSTGRVNNSRVGSSADQWTFVRANIDLLEDFPIEDGDTFTHADLPARFQHPFFRKIRARDLVETVGRKTRKGSQVNVYRMKQVFVELIDRYERDDNRIRMPCGHDGVKNLGDGEFSCSRSECDATFGREIAQEALGR